MYKWAYLTESERVCCYELLIHDLYTRVSHGPRIGVNRCGDVVSKRKRRKRAARARRSPLKRAELI